MASEIVEDASRPGRRGSERARSQGQDSTLSEPEHAGEDEHSPFDVVEEEVVRLTPGDIVPSTRYRIERWLGEGGMGVVYECSHIDLERRVALKILRADAKPGSRRAKMFREEARAVSRAASSSGGHVSNIVEIYDFGELPDGRLWFAMELLRGKSLARTLSEGPMAPERLLPILRQVCKGLAAAHDANVVHRDVKPGNVMLLEGGRPDTVKLVDFGVAAVLSEAGRTRVQLEGTPIYMSPEQVTGSSFDRRLDVYSVGAMAYHLLCGVPPFLGDTIFQILQKHRSKPPRPFAEANPSVSVHPALERVVLRCLAKRPEERWDDMRDLEAALCEAQIAAKIETAWDDLPLPDVEPDRREALVRAFGSRLHGRTRSRSRWLWGGVAALLLLGAGGWLTWGRTRVEEAPTQAIPPEIVARIEAAKDAAARAELVYPSPDAPQRSTAYTEVLALEALEVEHGAQARKHAAELRDEFADTLNRLGDRYWDRPGGRPFAVDYYIAALLFRPDDRHARTRAPVTPGELVALREKAARLEFTEAELTASKPLVALAEENDEERVRKLRALEEEVEALGVQADLKIKQLIEQEHDRSKVVDASRKKKAVAPKAQETTAVDELAADAPLDEAPRSKRDVERSKALAKEGLQALRSGQRDKAESLFFRALQADHTNHQALDGLAQVAFENGSYERAVRYARRAVSLAPRVGSYRIRLGDAYFKIFNYDRAKDEYAKAKSLGDAAAEARLERVRRKMAG